MLAVRLTASFGTSATLLQMVIVLWLLRSSPIT